MCCNLFGSVWIHALCMHLIFWRTKKKEKKRVHTYQPNEKKNQHQTKKNKQILYPPTHLQCVLWITPLATLSKNMHFLPSQNQYHHTYVNTHTIMNILKINPPILLPALTVPLAKGNRQGPVNSPFLFSTFHISLEVHSPQLLSKEDTFPGGARQAESAAAAHHSQPARAQGRAAAEDFRPTSPRAHWIGPESWGWCK